MTDIKEFLKYEIKLKNHLDEKILDEIVIGQYLIDLVNENDDLLSGVINGILCVESNGTENIDNIKGSKRRSQGFKHLPLKGLKKVHIRITSIQSLAINLNLGSQISNDVESPRIIENDLSTLIADYKKMKNAHKTLCCKRKNKSITGSWLVYGEIDNTRHYLDVYTGFEHSSESDSIIYQKLKENYSKEFLNQFLSKKIE